MKLYKIETPVPCDCDPCQNVNAVLIVRTTDEQPDYAVCPECVAAMSRMNNDNEEFFAQEPLSGYVGKGTIMNKRLLADGKFIVWQEGEQTIIHHQNGLTLQLTAQEIQDLKAWLDEQDTTWAERAEWESEQRMKEEQAPSHTTP